MDFNKKLQITNSTWNNYMFNSPWKVGFVTKIIKEKEFSSEEEWFDYYLKSGEKRLNKINKLSSKDKLLINSRHKSGDDELNKLNLNFGRSLKEINECVDLFYDKIKHFNLTRDDAYELFYQRLIRDTYIGIIGAEKFIKDELLKKIENIYLIDTYEEFDNEYSVDFEIYFEGKIVVGIQVKPFSYTGKADYLYKIRAINELKHKKYKEKFNRDIIHIYYTKNGEEIRVQNTEVIEELKGYISSK